MKKNKRNHKNTTTTTSKVITLQQQHHRQAVLHGRNSCRSQRKWVGEVFFAEHSSEEPLTGLLPPLDFHVWSLRAKSRRRHHNGAREGPPLLAAGN